MFCCYEGTIRIGKERSIEFSIHTLRREQILVRSTKIKNGSIEGINYFYDEKMTDFRAIDDRVAGFELYQVVCLIECPNPDPDYKVE